ncbi:MAG: hypothetical protein NVSMB3_11990 [Acidobacteriaceae bacterium]
MNIPGFRVAAIAGAALLMASVLSAQSGSMQSQTPSQQSTQQQQPGVNPAATSEMPDAGPNSGVSGQMMKDKIFLRKAAEGGMAEVQMGQLAAQKAGAEDVKEFGSRMVKDHTELNEEMKPIAESMGVMLPKKPSQKDQAEYDKLNGLSGSDFDTEYLTYMVKDHHMDLREFRLEAASTTDPALRSAVEKGQKIIHEHLTMVEQLARSKGISVPARGQRPPAPTNQ